MKTLYVFIALSILFSCSTNDSETKMYNDDDPKSLIGKWEVIKEFYDNHKVFDCTQNSNSDMGSSAKGNFIEIKKNGIATASVWTINESSFDKKDRGIYQLDNPTGRIRIEIPHKQESNLHSGSFRWKLKRNFLYLYSTNQPSGTYRVYRRVQKE